jgi:hypothetical protein
MATLQATNILTGTPEGAKYIQIGNCSEIWTVATTTGLASGDTISGPIIPANTYLVDVIVSWTDIDSSSGATFECGYTGTLGAFIATGNTTPASGGVVHANVAGTIGYTATTNTTVLVTMTGTAGTPVAGTCRICIIYTANP